MFYSVLRVSAVGEQVLKVGVFGGVVSAEEEEGTDSKRGSSGHTQGRGKALWPQTLESRASSRGVIS